MLSLHKSCVTNCRSLRTSVEVGNCCVRSPKRAKSLVEASCSSRDRNGWVQHQLDQCTFMFMNGTELVGLIGVYVDDFWVAGCEDDPVFSAALSKRNGTFQWGTWNEDNFTLTGIEIETLPDGGFHLRQQKIVDQLELMSLSQRRSRADIDKLTLGELTQLRGASGSANWLGIQSRPDLCVCTSLLQGAHASATVADTREANKLIRLCRQHAHVPIRVSRFLLTI